MPTGGVRNEGKSQFVKDVLKRNPFANAQAVNEEWGKSGKSGTISSTLVNKLRSAEGYAGNLRSGRKPSLKAKLATKVIHLGKKRGRKPRSIMAPAPALRADAHAVVRTRTAAQARDFDQIEADLDRLLFKVMELEGLSAVESELRKARRLLFSAYNG